MFSPQVYKNRRESLKQILKTGFYLFLGNNETPYNYTNNCYPQRQDSSFLYFFGLQNSGMAAVIDVDNDKEIIFANDLEIDDIIWTGPQPTVKELAAKCSVSESYPFAQLSTFVKQALSAHRKIHFLPPYRHDNMILLHELLGTPIAQLSQEASLDFVKAVISLRSVKEDIEIAEIERACAIGYEMHVTAMRMARDGVCEHEIVGMMDGISLSYGAGVSFPTILTRHGQTMHQLSHDNIIHTGDLLLHDAGAQTNLCYASDNTRTTPVGGRFSQRQKEIYQIVLDAHEAAFAHMKAGIPYIDVHIIACKVIVDGLKQLGLMKGDSMEAVTSGAYALFMPHGLGHMMGLDVHDMEDLGQIYVGYDDEHRPSKKFGLSSLRFARKLQKGFVLTDEPGIYFIPELIDKWKAENKFDNFINYNKVEQYRDFTGIRLEDDVLILENGARRLGAKRIPITIAEVENFWHEHNH